MSTQQDIDAAGSENRPPMLNKDNYVPWSSRIIRYARIPESFHEQTDEKLTENDIKRMDADDQAIQTILLGLLEDVYEKKAKLFNEWEKFTSTDGKSIESYYHRFMQLMNDLKRNKHFPENIAANLNNKYNPQPSLNQNFMQPPMTSLEDINDPTKVMNAALILFAKAFQLTAPTNNQMTSSNPRNLCWTSGTESARVQCLAEWWDSSCSKCISECECSEWWYQNGLVVVPRIANQNGTGNVVDAMAEGTINGNQARCYNCRELGHIARNCTARLRRRDDAYLQTQLLIAQKKEAGIQLQEEEFDFMAAAGDLDEIEEVNANCILMANLQHVSTSGTQLDKAPVYDTDGSAECLTIKINALHLSSAKQITTLNDEISNLNKQLSKEKSTISSLMEEKKKLKHDFKTREDRFLDKKIDLEAKIKDLENILLKKDQTVQTMHMLNPKPNSFYHPDQKMALGYPNPSYLKKAQLKQQSLYNGNLLLEEHDPPDVYDLEETLELAQERVFVPQSTNSKEELFLSNVSNMVTVSKTISIPNEDLLDDTTPSVARKFLNEEANESLDKQKSLELKIKRLLKASVSHDIVSIVQNGFVDVPSDLQTELDRTKEKLELCIIKKEKEYTVLWNNWYTKCEECKYDKISYDKAYNDMQQKVERLQAPLRDLKGKSSDTFSASNTLNPLNQKLQSKIIELEFQVVDKPKLIVVPPYSKKLHASILSHSVSQPREFNVVKHSNVIASGMFKIDPPQTSRENVSSNTVNASSTRLVHTARTRRPQPKGNTRNARVPYASKSSEVKKNVIVEDHLRILLLSKNQKTMSSECNNIKLDIWNDKFEIVCGTCNANQKRHRTQVVQICLWCVDSGCSKHMTGNIKLLINFVWKFLRTVRFENDHIAAILGYGDLKWGNITITRVYFVEGLGHNLFLEKSKRASHPPKHVSNLKQRLHLLHMNLCGPMRVASINGKRVGITHETSAVKTHQQNRVVERRNRTLIKAARTMLIFSHALLFLWAEAIATACYTQNRSIIHRRFNKTPYELIQGRKPYISYLHVFGDLYYPKNDVKISINLVQKVTLASSLEYLLILLLTECITGVCVPQLTNSKEELFLSNVSNMVTISKTISIPNEDLLDDTTPSVARKFLNKEANESLDKQKSLELEIKRLLKVSVSHDIVSIVQNGFVDVPSDLQTELDQCKYDKISYDKAYNDMQQKVERLQAPLRDIKGKSSDTSSASNTLNPLNQKLQSKIVELEFQVVNYEREIIHLKTNYKNLFDSITSNRAHAKLHNLIYKNAKLRARLFENTSESMNNTLGTSVTSQVDKPKLIAVPPYSKKLHASISSHFVSQPREFNVVKHSNVIAPRMFKIDPPQTSRVDMVPNK
nr:integrase, catalytic region, zinc finger, CCHC-type, peptidase aspartic, catalytic [Tanacetum cinerariifolium]